MDKIHNQDIKQDLVV